MGGSYKCRFPPERIRCFWKEVYFCWRNVVKLFEEAYSRFYVMEFSRLGRERERERVEVMLGVFWLVTFSLSYGTRMQTRIVGRILWLRKWGGKQMGWNFSGNFITDDIINFLNFPRIVDRRFLQVLGIFIKVALAFNFLLLFPLPLFSLVEWNNRPTGIIHERDSSISIVS